MRSIFAFLTFMTLLFLSCTRELPIEGKIWEKVTLDFEGPDIGEGSADNPFLNYRLDVTFSHDDTFYRVPGFYAQDVKSLTEKYQSNTALKMAIPTPDHYLPLLYTLGLRDTRDTLELFNDKLLAGSLSMTSVKLSQ